MMFPHVRGVVNKELLGVFDGVEGPALAVGSAAVEEAAVRPFADCCGGAAQEYGDGLRVRQLHTSIMHG